LGREALAAAELEEAATTASDKDHHTSRPLLLALDHFFLLEYLYQSTASIFAALLSLRGVSFIF
jgi:hypothetical protein